MARRLLWLIIGLVATACGIAGIVLPLVPTTPFLLLAAYAFARSSPHLYVWLVRHPRLGPPIRSWRTHGAISRKAKGWAVVAMAAALLISAAAGIPAHILLVQACVLAVVAAFVLSRPSGPRAGARARLRRAMRGREARRTHGAPPRPGAGPT